MQRTKRKNITDDFFIVTNFEFWMCCCGYVLINAAISYCVKVEKRRKEVKMVDAEIGKTNKSISFRFQFFPLITLAGSVISAQISCRTPSTAIPIILNGSRSSHTNGYNIKASNANGPHNIKRIHQSKNFIITKSPDCSIR